MAIGRDRVQVLKRESVLDGGDLADSVEFNAKLRPNQDAIESAGGYVQEFDDPPPTADELVGWFRDSSGNFNFFDVANPGSRTLSELLSGGDPVITRAITNNTVIAGGTTRLGRCSSVANGIELRVLADGEFLVL